MSLVETGSLVASGRGSGRGDGAFNIITLEYVEAVIADAQAAGSPRSC
ncbi:hypothetical protein [Glaciihabitans sp. UYNi722]